VADARFLLRPRWLLSHLLVILLVVVMINLGFWQLRRLDFKRDRNALIESRMDQPVAAVEDLVGPDADAAAVDGARYRRVDATGTYDDDATVIVRNRSQDGAPGGWLVTPMTVAPGTTVGVVRGFVGFQPDGDLVAAPAPDGQVTVEGLVIDPSRLDGTAPRDLAPFLAGDGVVPALVLAQDSTPPEPAAPTDAREQPAIGPIVPVPPPELSEGPHLSYAVQWFIFSTIAIVGYPLVLRRVVARRGKEVDDEPDGETGLPGGTPLAAGGRTS
jgi:cytochrome oxidase assembly protein ShyY1